MEKHDIKPRLSVGIILAKRFTLSAFANFVDILRLSADEGDRSRQILCQWRVLSADMRPVSASCGMTLAPTDRLIDPRQFHYIVVIGGLMDEVAQLDQTYLDYLRKAASVGVPLIGICTGAFILHRAGLMKGYRCCVSWFHHNDFIEEFDDLIPISDQIFVVDRDRITCSGGTSSARLAAWLVEKHVGRAQAHKSLNIMIIDHGQTGEAVQPGPSLPKSLQTKDPLVRRSLLLMQQSCAAPRPISSICNQLGVTRRTLERRFNTELNLSPAAADRIIRVQYARHLISDRGFSVSDAANEAGFCDASHFNKTLKAIRTLPEPTKTEQA